MWYFIIHLYCEILNNFTFFVSHFLFFFVADQFLASSLNSMLSLTLSSSLGVGIDWLGLAKCASGSQGGSVVGWVCPALCILDNEGGGACTGTSCTSWWTIISWIIRLYVSGSCRWGRHMGMRYPTSFDGSTIKNWWRWF